MIEKFIAQNRAAFDGELPSKVVWSRIEAALGNSSDKNGELEQFIYENRSAFDSEAPSAGLWETLSKNLEEPGAEKPPKRFVFSTWRKPWMQAAAAILILVSGVFIGRSSLFSVETVEQMAAKELTDEQTEALSTFERRVSARMVSASSVLESKPDVVQDLAHLDRIMAELREELGHVPASKREQVVQALLDSYKAKIHILEKIQERLPSKAPSNQLNTLQNEVLDL